MSKLKLLALLLVSFIATACNRGVGKVVEVCYGSGNEFCQGFYTTEYVHAHQSKFVYLYNCRSEDDSHNHAIYFLRG